LPYPIISSRLSSSCLSSLRLTSFSPVCAEIDDAEGRFLTDPDGAKEYIGDTVTFVRHALRIDAPDDEAPESPHATIEAFRPIGENLSKAFNEGKCLVWAVGTTGIIHTQQPVFKNFFMVAPRYSLFLVLLICNMSSSSFASLLRFYWKGILGELYTGEQVVNEKICIQISAK
jgi:hypothetical protein